MDAHDQHGDGHNDGHGHDEWFRHGPEDGLPQAEHAAHISASGLGISLLLTTFGVLAVVIILSLYFDGYTTQLAAEKQEGTGSADPYLAYRNAAMTNLSGDPKPLDRKNGVYRIPVDRAMDIVVAEYAEGID